MHALLLSLLGIGGMGGIAALAVFCPTFLVAALEFLKAIPKQVWYVIAVVALVLTLCVQHQHFVHKAITEAKAQQKAVDDAARAADRAAYMRAQSEAKAANDAHNKQVEQQYQRNTDDERQVYLSDRAKLIAYYNGLRAHAQVAPGPANNSNPSAPISPSTGADGNGLQVSSADDLQTKQDAADIELRLMHLQHWVENQLAVDPNK